MGWNVKNSLMHERDIQKDICKMLQKNQIVAFYSVVTTGTMKRGPVFYHIGKWFRENKKCENHDGMADLIGMTTNGIFFAIEVKSATGKATKEQLEFLKYVDESGGIAGIARSVEDAEMIIMEFSINI